MFDADKHTWWQYTHDGSSTPRHAVVQALGDLADDFDVDALTDRYTAAINDALPDEIALVGANFIIDGPDDELGEVIRDAVGAADLWEIAKVMDLGVLHELHEQVRTAEAALTAAKAARDEAIRQADAAGLSAYRMAKRLGVAESTVGRILKR
jgi:hypothetical protein